MRLASLALAALALALIPSHPARAQAPPQPQAKTAQQLDLEGVWMGYDGEWHHTTYQLLALAEATPADKFSFRPEPGVRSMSEVYMHIVITNYWLLSLTGHPTPPGLKGITEKSVTAKPEVIAWLKRSLEAVRQAHLQETPAHLAKKVHVADRDTTVEGIYQRIIIHTNEHMGQLIAYARMAGVVPPWSQ